MKRKILAIVALMLLCISACGQSALSDNNISGIGNEMANNPNVITNNVENANAQSAIVQNEDSTAVIATETFTLEECRELVIESTADEAQTFSENLKVGWNLGNTFDAYDDNMEIQGSGLVMETKWCGVYTTKELIDEVKALGFDTIRIPVSWHNHIEGNDFVIGERWLDRVQQIVDYALENDMYVILNIHHDVNKKYYYPDSEHMDSSTHYLQCIWLQLADRFKNYDNRLIFEPINEPRLVGHKNEWWLENNSDCKDSMEAINKLNQVFVDTVRSTGGNNVNRYLIIPGYDSSPEGALNDSFTMPEDIASHKLLVTVHAYTPYELALADSSVTAFTDKDREILDDMMQKLDDKFVSQGIPVLIGEFGIRDKNNISDRAAFTDYYIRAAKKHGMACLWWDNNAFDYGEVFGLINRADLTIVWPEIVDAMINAANE